MEHIDEFKYWVQKVLPAVYDDSLSYYELLNKIVAKLNDVITQGNEVVDLSNEFFNEDHLKSHVAFVLDDFSNDGTLETIINQEIFADITDKSNNPLGQMADGTIPSRKLSTATDADKITSGNLSNEVIGMMTGTTPVGTTPGLDSVTTETIASGAVLPEHLGFRYKTGAILTQTLKIDTTAKTVAFDANAFVSVNGKYYTVLAQTVAYTGQNYRVQYVYLNEDTLGLEVHENNLGPAHSNLILLCSWYSGEVHNTTTPKRIWLDGTVGKNVKTATSDVTFKYHQATVLAGTIDVTQVDGAGTITSTGLLVSLNGVFVSVTNSTLTYDNPNNRIQYVYVNTNTNTLERYENNLAPHTGNLALLFSFYNGLVYNSDSFKGITVNGTPAKTNITALPSLTGLRVNVLGDSITAGDGGTVPYSEILKNITGASVVRNYGVSGTTVGYWANNAVGSEMSTRYTTMDNNADVVFVLGGTNDYWRPVPLGTMDDADNTTFYGALHILCRGLIEKYPNAFICFGTPPKSWRSTGYPNEGPNGRGHMAEDYNEAVKKVCGLYAIPVLDLKHDLNIDPSITVHFNTYTSDGIHYNNRGYEVIGRTLASFIETQYNR